MKKEDILKQLKAEEDFEYADNQGRKIGYIVFVALFVVFVVVSLNFGEMAVLFAVNALFWSLFSAEGYTKFYFLRRRKYMFRALLGSAIFVVSVVHFCLILLN